MSVTGYLNKILTEGTIVTEATGDEVISAFVNGTKSARTANLMVTKNNHGRVLINYETPIAFISNDGKAFVSSTKYSVTTSKFQNKIRNTMKSAGMEYTDTTDQGILDAMEGKTDAPAPTEKDKKIVPQSER